MPPTLQAGEVSGMVRPWIKSYLLQDLDHCGLATGAPTEFRRKKKRREQKERECKRESLPVGIGRGQGHQVQIRKVSFFSHGALCLLLTRLVCPFLHPRLPVCLLLSLKGQCRRVVKVWISTWVRVLVASGNGVQGTRASSHGESKDNND